MIGDMVFEQVLSEAAKLEHEREEHMRRQRAVLRNPEAVRCAHCDYCYVPPAPGESTCPLCKTLNASEREARGPALWIGVLTAGVLLATLLAMRQIGFRLNLSLVISAIAAGVTCMGACVSQRHTVAC